MLSSLRLPLRFEPAPLQADVAALPPEDWVPHFNASYYEGDWSGVALRSVGGAARQLYPDPNPQGSWEDTEILGYCPAIASAVAAFECEDLGAPPAARPRRKRARHTDHNLGYEDGEVRFHVPVQTNPDTPSSSSKDGRSRCCPARPGTSTSTSVTASRTGATPRIHLVLDCVVNDWVSRMLAAAERR